MKRCQRCGKELAEGAVAYAFEFRLFADFDGVVDPDDDETFDRALALALHEDQKALEDEIYLEGRALLCPSCREEILQAFGLAAGGEEDGGNEEPPDDGGADTVH